MRWMLGSGSCLASGDGDSLFLLLFAFFPFSFIFSVGCTVLNDIAYLWACALKVLTVACGLTGLGAPSNVVRIYCAWHKFFNLYILLFKHFIQTRRYPAHAMGIEKNRIKLNEDDMDSLH